MKTLAAALMAVLFSVAGAVAGEPEEKKIGFYLFTGVLVTNTGSITSETAFFSKLSTCLLAKTTFNYVYRIGMGIIDTDGVQNNRIVANFSRCIDLSKMLRKIDDVRI